MNGSFFCFVFKLKRCTDILDLANMMTMNFQFHPIVFQADVDSIDAYTKIDHSNAVLECPYDRFLKISNSPSL